MKKKLISLLIICFISNGCITVQSILSPNDFKKMRESKDYQCGMPLVPGITGDIAIGYYLGHDKDKNSKQNIVRIEGAAFGVMMLDALIALVIWGPPPKKEPDTNKVIR